MMHVRVLGAEGAGGAAEEIGKEAAVTAHAAHGRTRRLMRPAASAGGAAWGERVPLQSRAAAVTWGQPRRGPVRSDPLQRAVTAEELIPPGTPCRSPWFDAVRLAFSLVQGRPVKYEACANFSYGLNFKNFVLL
jgi:hypothetical protein